MHLKPSGRNAGTDGSIVLTATPAEQWHVYALAEKAAAVGSKPTLIVLTDLPAGWKAAAPQTSSPPITKQDGPADSAAYHEGQ